MTLPILPPRRRAVGCSRGRRGCRDQRAGTTEAGGGVVLVLGIAAVLFGLTLLAAGLGAATLTRHRVQAAADLAALGAFSAGPEPRCDRAAEVARSSGGWLITCRVLIDGTVVVEVGCRLPGWLDQAAGEHQPVGRARAGRSMPAAAAAHRQRGPPATATVPPTCPTSVRTTRVAEVSSGAWLEKAGEG